ncbi:hypothetical protein PTKIN_Ptkin15bG0076500 [Pterospermum kingtungense]
MTMIVEKVRDLDERIPLNKSISSSQTIYILASSGSSLKSITSNTDIEQGEIAKTTPFVDGKSTLSRSSEERDKADGKELLDDGREIFDRDNCTMKLYESLMQNK